jgi:hypothetical protein
LGGGLRPADRLVNLWELLDKTAPEEEPFLHRELAALGEDWKSLRPARALRPKSWARDASVSCAAALLLAWLLSGSGAGAFAVRRVLWPWGSEASWITVSPGDARVPSGESVTVSVRLRVPSASAPELFVREKGGDWERRPLVRSPDGSHRAVLERVVEPLSYRARHRGLWSDTHTLTPFLPPRLDRLRLTVRPPAYLGAPAETYDELVSLRAPEGAALEGEAVPDRPLREARLTTPEGTDVPLFPAGPGGFRFRGVVRRTGAWTFHLTTKEGDSAEVPVSVEAVPDQPPLVRLLSPEGNVSVSVRSRLPVVYETSDDHGLARVRLVVKADDGSERIVPLSKDSGVREEVVTPLRLGLAPGRRADAWVEAADGNPAGTGFARSAVFSLLVTDKEGDRLRREQALERWRDGLMAARTDEDLLRGKAAAPNPDWRSLAGRQDMASEGLRELTKDLEKIVEESGTDDPWLSAEHAAALDAMKDLLRDAAPRAKAALSEGRRDAAASALEEVVSGLDRIASASEAAGKASHARALSGRDDYLDAAQELSDAIKNGDMSAEERKIMDAVMAEIAQSLGEVAAALQTLPGFLPDAPAGTDPSQVLKMSDMLKNLMETKDALDRGDAVSARKAAERLLEQLKQMRKILAAGGGGAGGDAGGMPPALSEELDAAAEEVRALAKRQEALIGRTEAVRDAAGLRLKQAQDKAMLSMPVSTVVTSPTYTEDDAARLRKAADDQDALRRDTAAFREKIEALTRKTMLLSPRSLTRLRKAGEAMEKASEFLRKVQPAEASSPQDEALNLLQDEVRDAESLKRGAGGSGEGAAFGMGAGARGGGSPVGPQPAGPTRLPRAGDYRPPKEFREELLKALEEKYPSRQGPLIEDYFKRWKK